MTGKKESRKTNLGQPLWGPNKYLLGINIKTDVKSTLYPGQESKNQRLFLFFRILSLIFALG